MLSTGDWLITHLLFYFIIFIIREFAFSKIKILNKTTDFFCMAQNHITKLLYLLTNKMLHSPYLLKTKLQIAVLFSKNHKNY